MKDYNFSEIESKWQKNWASTNYGIAEDFSNKPKSYNLVEFPYPSGSGLHVGHCMGYGASDAYCRMKRMQGFNVMFPIGWDAFGLPTENYAIKNKIKPQIITAQAIDTFRTQMKTLGYSFDWSREVNTTDPNYYKWTQWIFSQFYKHSYQDGKLIEVADGDATTPRMAYQAEMNVNWCPSCKIVLANEEVVSGACERCGTVSQKRNQKQWMLRITAYAERLMDDLATVDYLETIKTQQINWIGKSIGSNIKFKIKESDRTIDVFTTRADTLFGCTYVVLAPENPLVNELKSQIGNIDEVQQYIDNAKNKTDIERTDTVKTKIGVKLEGIKAINPINNEEVEVYAADYVLASYGTGAVMAVPAHDKRDFEFAKKYNIQIKQVITNTDNDIDVKNNAFTDYGILINSSEFDGLSSNDAKTKITEKLKLIDAGELTTNFKMRDWIFSRQHYWGEPIPIIHCDKCAKKTKVILAHGITGNNQENWFPWFKTELEKRGYEVSIPNLPNSDYPKIDDWVETLKQLIEPDKHIILVGHSLGVPAICQLIIKEQLNIDKLILVGPTGNSQGEANWTNLRNVGVDEKEIEIIKSFNSSNTNLDKISKYARTRVIYLSDNDPFIPLTVESDYKEISAAIKMISKKGHFNHAAGITEFVEILDEFPETKKTVAIPVPEDQLPVTLPDIENYEPTTTGESPLAKIDSWVNVDCPICGGKAKRETDTMPNWAGSSWYFLRYCDPKNPNTIADMKNLKYWTPVDLYNGGPEHITLHLLYSRFWHKFLFDLGAVPTTEPYQKRILHGIILGPDGQKMSKSKGNVINPDDMVKKFGADTLRAYIMFIGPYDQASAWSMSGIMGVHRFLKKLWANFDKVKDTTDSEEILVKLNQTIKSITDDLENYHLNTVISGLMEMNNLIEKTGTISKSSMKILLQLLCPVCPHIASEMWEMLGEKENINQSSWPKADEKYMVANEIELAVSINGKTRAVIKIKSDATENDVINQAKADEKIKVLLEGKNIQKTIYVTGRILNFVVE